MKTKTVIHNDFHVWNNTQGHIVVSDEATKRLYTFHSKEEAVRMMYVMDESLARKINENY